MLDVEKVTGAFFGTELIGTAPFEINLLKNKRHANSDKNIFEDLIEYLDTHAFESSDVGEYQCCLSNEVGKITSKSIAMIRG